MCEMVSVFSSAFAFVLVGLSVYLSAHVLKLTDVTCEASVGIGGCCYGALVLSGLHPIFAFGTIFNNPSNIPVPALKIGTNA